MLPGVNPNALDEHVARCVHPTPRELSRKVFDVAARLAVRREKRFGPHTEPRILLQPATLLVAAGMRGILDPTTGHCVEVRRVNINQASSPFTGDSFAGAHHPECTPRPPKPKPQP